MDVNALVKVTARAWSLEILALLDAGVAARQAVLLAASGASRTAFAQSLTHLVELGLLMRNPGHGHPLRPEFVLTPSGLSLARIARGVVDAVPPDTDFGLLRKTWTVPVLAVTQAPRRFSEVKMDLAGITDRALSKTLDQLQDRAWLRRDVDVAAKPLRPLYQAANTGLAISRAVSI